MKKITLLIAITLLYSILKAQNVGISSTGTMPDVSAMLDVSASNKGLLMPRITLTSTTDITTIPSAATSLLVYNTATVSDVSPGYYYWDAIKWVRLIENGTTSGADWSLTGNAGTTAGTNFLGTTDAQDLVFKTNGVENVRIANATGRVGIGTVTPSDKLHVSGGSMRINNDGYSIYKSYVYGTTPLVSPHFIGYRARGTEALPTHPITGDVLATFQGRNAISNISSAGFSIMAAENHTSSANGSFLKLSTTINGGGGSVERMRITEDGNVGVGTTAPTHILHLSGAPVSNALLRITSTNVNIDAHIRYDYPANSNNYWLAGCDASSVLASDFIIWNSVRANVDFLIDNSNGNIGIGMLTPSEKLHVSGGNIEIVTGNRTGKIWDGTSTIDGVEINTVGYIGVQRGTAGTCLALSKPTGYLDSQIISFFVNGTIIGTITTPGGASVSYNTTSDKRLKENIKETTFGLKTIEKMKLYDYHFKSDQSKTLHTGFLAQELYILFPEAVTEGGEDPKTDPWMVDYSKLVPVLAKGIQEQQKIITDLTSRLSALEKMVIELQK